MSSSTPPIIAFELGVGEFRIVTPEAVYQIRVSPDLVEASQGLPAAGSEAESGGEPAFFREISEELFDKVGRLARKLSVSVEELPSQLDAPDLDQTDQQLENAKGQLEEVVKITEKASMTIMDTADQIQTDMDQLKNQLDILQQLDLMAEPAPDASPPPEGERPLVTITDQPPVIPGFLEKLSRLKDLVENLLAGAGPGTPPPTAAAAPAPPPEPEPEPEPEPAAPPQIISVTTFNVDVIFQTLYEFCTNESVKDHIKIMREAQDAAFNTQEVADALSELARTLEEEDGAYNFPIPAILKALYAATASEEYRTTLKKMNQTAASIFLDNVLPIEGETREIEVPAAAPAPAAEAPAAETPAPPAPPEAAEAPADDPEAAGRFCSWADLQAIQGLIAEMEQLARSGPSPTDMPPGALLEAGAHPGLYTSILTQDRDTIVTTVNMANQLIQQTGHHLTGILEALSFQDLSGQRIMKVVALLSDVQMQLLSILVSVNAKIKVHQSGGPEELNPVKAEKMAQEEVDKALEKVSVNSSLLGPGAEARLDQGAVNDLLAQLGF